jgi:hypothetical protein
MNNNDDVIRLLTEIRDIQREDVAWRRQAVEDSVRLQRKSLRAYRIGIVCVVALMCCLVVLVCAFMMDMSHR